MVTSWSINALPLVHDPIFNVTSLARTTFSTAKSMLRDLDILLNVCLKDFLKEHHPHSEFPQVSIDIGVKIVNLGKIKFSYAIALL